MIMNERSRVQLTAASRCYMPGNRLAFSWTRGPGLLDKQCFPDLTERSMIFRFLLSVLRRILSHKGRCKVKAGSSCWTAGAVCCICTQLLIPKLLCLTCTLPPVCLVFFFKCVCACVWSNALPSLPSFLAYLHTHHIEATFPTAMVTYFDGLLLGTV